MTRDYTERYLPGATHIEGCDSEPPADRHAARQWAIELDADRGDRRGRIRHRRVDELHRDDREDRAAVIGQIRKRLAVERDVRERGLHRLLVHVAVVPVDERLLAL